MNDPFLQAKANALLTVYRERWDRQWREQFDILEVETEFSFSLLNPETNGVSRSFDEAGKMDVLARHRSTGKLVVIEHKTTSDDVDPASDYWDRLRMDTQVSKYFLAASLRERDVQSVLYDVIKKPGQRPCQVPLKDDNDQKIVLDANGQRVYTKDGKKPRETGDAEKGWVLQTRPEPPIEYERRVLSVLRESPDHYFAQREVGRLDSDILEYMADAWDVGQQILYFRNRQLWPRNPQACKYFGSTCEYLDLCSGRASVDNIRFRIRDTVHPELKLQASNGRELLTNSRMSALRKCCRFHQLRYEQRVERVDDEGKEALTFGTIVHEGLESYFRSLIKA